MSNANCLNCDRPECQHATRTAEQAFDAARSSRPFDAKQMRMDEAELYKVKTACNANAVDWRARALAAEARIRECAASLADIEREDPDSLDDYHKGFRHGCQDMIAILCGEP